MKIDWKDAAVKTLMGTTVGMAIITVIGYWVDGDETYVFQGNDKSTAVITSYRGGLFAHAHKLKQCNDDADGNIQFTVESAVGHSHASTTDVYTVEFNKRKQTCAVTARDALADTSKPGGGHTHKLKVVCFIEKDGTIYDKI